jgi:hypothetical protein
MVMRALFPTAGDGTNAQRLATALGIADQGSARALVSYGLEPESAFLVTWLPAVQVAWLGGLTQAEQRRLKEIVRARHPNLTDHAERLLDGWLQRKPHDALFRIGRRVLHSQLAALSPTEHPALIARVVGPCVDLAHVSGGVLGVGAVSADERAWLSALAAELAVYSSQAADGARDPLM